MALVRNRERLDSTSPFAFFRPRARTAGLKRAQMTESICSVLISLSRPISYSGENDAARLVPSRFLYIAVNTPFAISPVINHPLGIKDIVRANFEMFHGIFIEQGPLQRKISGPH